MRECEFLGAAAKDFLFEKIDIAADRGYGVIVEPVGRENNRVFNIYQVTPSMAKSAPKLYEACKVLLIGLHSSRRRIGYKLEEAMMQGHKAMDEAKVK